MYFPLVDIYSSGVERIWPSSNLTVNNIWIVWISRVIWLISMIVCLFSRVIDWLQWLYCLLPSHCTTWLIDWLSVLLEQDVAKAASLQWCDWLIDCVFYKSRTPHRQPPYSGVIDWLTVCSTGAGHGTGSRPTAVWLMIDWLTVWIARPNWLIDWLTVCSTGAWRGTGSGPTAAHHRGAAGGPGATRRQNIETRVPQTCTTALPQVPVTNKF